MDESHRKLLENMLEGFLVDSGGMRSIEQIQTRITTPEFAERINETAVFAREMANITNQWAAKLQRSANTLTSPIYSLPLEILQWILRDAIGAEATRWYYRFLHRLRSVSTRWKQAIDDLPLIWAKIWAYMPEHAIHMSMEKAKGMAVSVNFEGRQAFRSPSEEEDQDTEPPMVADCLVASSDRWGTLDVCTSHTSTAYRLLAAEAACLKTLKMDSRMGGTIGEDLGDMLEVFMRSAPLLESVDIGCWDFSWKSAGSALNSLRSLTLQERLAPSIVFDDFLRLLSCCLLLTSLELVHVDFWMEDGEPDNIQPPVSLPSLQELSISWSFNWLPALLSAINIPPTCRISLEFCGEAKEGTLKKLAQWFSSNSVAWQCPNTLEVRYSGYTSVNFGDGHLIAQKISDHNILRSVLAFVDQERRIAVTEMTLIHYKSALRNRPLLTDPPNTYLAVLHEFFPSITQLIFWSAKPEWQEAFLRNFVLPTPWIFGGVPFAHALFPKLTHLELRGNTERVAFQDVVAFVAKRHGSDAQKSAASRRRSSLGCLSSCYTACSPRVAGERSFRALFDLSTSGRARRAQCEHMDVIYGDLAYILAPLSLINI